MNKNNLLMSAFVAAFVMLAGCAKETQTKDVIALETQATSGTPGDDSTQTAIYANIPWQAQGKTIVFTAARGRFVGGTAINPTGNTVSADASISNHKSGKWTAVVGYIAPSARGTDTITAYIKGLVPQYIDTLAIALVPSEPATIAISAGAPNVKTNYGGTVTIVGNLLSATGLKVAQGTPVLFAIGGNTQYFSPNPVFSNSKSQVTTTFNPAMLPAGETTINASVTGTGITGSTVILLTN